MAQLKDVRRKISKKIKKMVRGSWLVAAPFFLLVIS